MMPSLDFTFSSLTLTNYPTGVSLPCDIEVETVSHRRGRIAIEIHAVTIARDGVFGTVSEGVLTQRLVDELAILDANNGQYYYLNEVGAEAWSLLHQGNGLNAIRQSLLNRFQVSNERLTADLVALLNDLQARGLVSFHDEQAA